MKDDLSHAVPTASSLQLWKGMVINMISRLVSNVYDDYGVKESYEIIINDSENSELLAGVQEYRHIFKEQIEFYKSEVTAVKG